MTLPHARNFERTVPPARTGAALPKKPALYTPEERARRDASPWTLVQAILAPLQFFVFAISLALVLRFLLTGEGYVVATASILAKTLILYLIMITGSVWEKEVFGKWLFARAFFWEDVFSMLVLALHTLYLAALFNGWGTPQEQMLLAVAAYATYVINAGQFLLKLREARLEAALSQRERVGAQRRGEGDSDARVSTRKETVALTPAPLPPGEGMLETGRAA